MIVCSLTGVVPHLVTVVTLYFCCVCLNFINLQGKFHPFVPKNNLQLAWDPVFLKQAIGLCWGLCMVILFEGVMVEQVFVDLATPLVE